MVDSTRPIEPLLKGANAKGEYQCQRCGQWGLHNCRPQSIPEVLSTIEQRQFWERVYRIVIRHPDRYNGDLLPEKLADDALAAWRERFGPKAAE